MNNHEHKHTVAVAEVLRKSIFGDFLIFVVSGQGKRAESTGTIRFFIEYPDNAKYSTDENCVSCFIKSSENLRISV